VVNPLGVKGMGELGMVGIPAAIANSIRVFYETNCLHLLPIRYISSEF
jgi:CO/xanthine dehydrogenase Mo-binding subunit